MWDGKGECSRWRINKTDLETGDNVPEYGQVPGYEDGDKDYAGGDDCVCFWGW